MDPKREQALDAVMRCFWTHGFEGTSLGKLEAATGLGRQSLYNAFGTKEDMFGAALERYAQNVSAPLAAMFDRNDPEKSLRRFLDGYLALIENEAVPPGCMIASCTSELGPRADKLGERMRVQTDENLNALRSIFRTWREDGYLRQEADPDALAALFAVIVRGLAVLHRGGADRGTLLGAVEGAIASFHPFFRHAAESKEQPH